MTDVASGGLTDSQPLCLSEIRSHSHMNAGTQANATAPGLETRPQSTAVCHAWNTLRDPGWPQTQKAACLDLQTIFNLINQSD